jgi:hypothetical protein
MLHSEPLCVEGVSIVATEQIADMNETIEASGKDRPLRDDIRLLGRIPGDTVREQEGGAVFDIVERIRQTSISARFAALPSIRTRVGALISTCDRIQ